MGFEISGIDELDAAFRRMGEVPDSVTAAALQAGGEVAAWLIKAKGEAKRIRSDKAPHILDKIKVGKFKKTQDGGYVEVYFSGTQKSSPGAKPVSNGRIAFENEYGNSNQQARPFVGPAIAEGEETIVRPIADVLFGWMEEEWDK